MSFQVKQPGKRAVVLPVPKLGLKKLRFDRVVEVHLAKDAGLVTYGKFGTSATVPA
jgi:hypothetical protein